MAAPGTDRARLAHRRGSPRCHGDTDHSSGYNVNPSTVDPEFQCHRASNEHKIVGSMYGDHRLFFSSLALFLLELDPQMRVYELTCYYVI